MIIRTMMKMKMNIMTLMPRNRITRKSILRHR